MCVVYCFTNFRISFVAYGPVLFVVLQIADSSLTVGFVVVVFVVCNFRSCFTVGFVVVVVCPFAICRSLLCGFWCC